MSFIMIATHLRANTRKVTSKKSPAAHPAAGRFGSKALSSTEVRWFLLMLLSQKMMERVLGFGELGLYTHDYSGKAALARNEVLDGYYERTHLVFSPAARGQ